MQTRSGWGPASLRRAGETRNSLVVRYIVRAGIDFRGGSASVAGMARTQSNHRVSLEDYRTLADFRYALRKFLNFSAEAAQGAGLTPRQHQVLLAIKGFPERDHASIGELAERLQLRHHSTVGLVDRLEQRRLVKRTVAPEDRRKVWVTLTDKGEKLIGGLSAAHKRELIEFGPELRKLLRRLGS